MATATKIVHWPGNYVPACDEHAAKLRNLAQFMGFPVSMTPATDEIECTNCENEAKKAEAKL